MKWVCFIIGILFFYPSNVFSECKKGNCSSGQGTYKFSDGAVYTGSFKRGLPHGKGRILFKGNASYEGFFRDGRIDGTGTYKFSDGKVYTGEIRKGSFHGNGKMVYPDGSSYIGQWQDNKPHGRGTFYPNGKDPITGDFERGKLVTQEVLDEGSGVKDCNSNYCHNETGRFKYRNGSIYEGDFIDGKPEGSGKILYASGEIYSGEWKNHAPHGYGTIIYSDGKKKTGYWNYGNLAKKATVEHHAGGDGNTRVHALIVGVAAYEYMPSLRYTDDDAYRLYAFLKSPEGGAVKDDQITLLVDEAATKKEIMKAIHELKSQADEDDAIMVYFSGHGLDGRLLPIDFDGYKNSLSYADIVASLDQSKAKNKIFITDACYSGSLSESRGGLQESLDQFYNELKSSRGGTAILMSSGPNEKSLEYGGIRQGVFSHFLLKGMQGAADVNKNRIVSVTELYDYVLKRVKGFTDNRQTPIIAGDFERSMPVSFVR